jgi:hypothetical protein
MSICPNSQKFKLVLNTEHCDLLYNIDATLNYLMFFHSLIYRARRSPDNLLEEIPEMLLSTISHDTKDDTLYSNMKVSHV